MTSANDRQEGGSHYRSATIQHWDLISKNRVGYLEGNATKYLTRWRKKNGVEDLKKSLHYVDKLIELAGNSEVSNHSSFANKDHTAYLDLEVFYQENELEGSEQLAIFWLLTWDCLRDLDNAKNVILGIITEAASYATTPGTH